MAVTIPGLPFDFILTEVAAGTVGFVFKSTHDAFYYNGTIVTKITDADYPAVTVRGVAYLDGTYYVMDANGVIYGSDINAPLSWNALTFITAQMEPDGGVYLGRLLNFIVAMGTYTTEFFYDAGNATGSPLSPYTSSMLNMGCAVAESVAQTNNQLIFMGVSKQKGRSIYVLTGTAPEPISTPSVERIINADDLAAVASFCVKISGHNFYVLTLGTTGITLACDLTTKDWKEWTSSVVQATKTPALTYSTATGLVTASLAAHGYSDVDPVVIAGGSPTAYNGVYNITYVDANTFTYTPLTVPASTPATGTITSQGWTTGPFIGKFYTGFSSTDLIQDSHGNIYTMSTGTYTDNGNPIDVRIRTALLDGGMDSMKFFGRLEVIGDQTATTLYVRYTGDDYQTYSPYRPVSLAGKRAMLTRLGRDRRRAFEVRHTDNTPLRLEALELTVEKGSN
jgi:hypothetical protein